MDVDEHARRFEVHLFIVHSNLEPTEIATALDLEPQIVRRTEDIRWRFCVRHEVADQWFGEKVTEFVDRLVPHKEYFRRLRSTGGTAGVIFWFLGDGYFGDEIPRTTLKKLIDLELDLAVEVFQLPQSR